MSSYRYTCDDLVSQGRVTAQEVTEIREWTEKQESIPELDDVQLALFVIACKRQIADTKRCIAAYYEVKRNGPKIFDGTDIHAPEMEHQLRMLEFCVMPVRTADNSAIILHRLKDPNPSNYHMETAMNLLFMTLDASLIDGPPNSLTILFDMRFVSLLHLTRVKIKAIQLFFQYLQEGLPIMLKEIHIFNVVWFFDKCLAIFKPFMNPELMRKLHLHKSGMDMKEFNEKYNLPKSALPSDFEGDLPSIEELHSQNCQTLDDLQRHFQSEVGQRKALSDKIH